MGKYLEDMFNHLHTTYHGLQSRLKAEGFKDRVVRVLKAWTEWLVYDREFIHKLEAIFLGIQKVHSPRIGCFTGNCIIFSFSSNIYFHAKGKASRTRAGFRFRR